MSATELVTRLSEHRLLGDSPREELEWLAAHGEVRHMQVGETVSRKAEPVEGLVIVLSGHFSIHVDRGLGPRKVMEWGAGDVGGVLPYSRLTNPPGDAVVEEPGDNVIIRRELVRELPRQCPVVTEKLVHAMLDRTRRFHSSDLQDEKMASLGRLSAGLAHELNNPASAAARSVRLLIESMGAAEVAARALGAARLSDDQVAIIERMRGMCVAASLVPPSPLERADREEALSEWLDRHGVDSAAAAALVDAGTSIESLEQLAAAVDGDGVRIALEWMSADCTSRALAAELERATTRIYNLVAAVKRFTYMDRTQMVEPVDVAPSVKDAVMILMHKARKKTVTVAVDLNMSLPRVRAIGGDLNQIWTNLIDNAIDAAPEGGAVSVTATPRVNFLCVRVCDNGSGVPADIVGRIFDPFFTTKPVGQGTGLGLDIVRQLVRRNGGDVEVDSKPGHTEFRVTLPIAAA